MGENVVAPPVVTRHRRSPRGSGRGAAAALVSVVAAVGMLGAACSSGTRQGSNRSGSSTTAASSAHACDGSVEAPDPTMIVDRCGRVVILRGANVEASSKGDTQAGTHLPTTPLGGQSTLQLWGWNSVRFLVFWGKIEPTKGVFDDAYLDGVQRWLDWYARHDIHVVLDMHQDLYAWAVGGDGAPDWAVDTRGAPITKIPDGQPWYLQGASPAVQNAYQSFWNPTTGQEDLEAEYFKALGHLVERFARHPAVIGYDVMNEPSFANGDLAATLAIQPQAQAGTFVNPNLTAFMQRGIDTVRAHDRDAWVMVEPTSVLNVFPYAGDLEFEKLHDPRKGLPRLTYAGHLYQQQVHDGKGYPEDDPYLATWERLRSAEAKRMKGSLWIGEWGGADQPRMDAYVAELMAMADRNMAGWAIWSWDPGGWSPVASDGTTASANGKRLMRVQPRAVAGTPGSFSWDPGSKVFRMEWAGRADVVGPTELAVPATLFPAGIGVVLDGASAEPDWDQERSVLRLTPPRSRGDHVVCVAPKGSNACGG